MKFEDSLLCSQDPTDQMPEHMTLIHIVSVYLRNFPLHTQVSVSGFSDFHISLALFKIQTM